MPASLSQAIEDYLKAIYMIAQHDQDDQAAGAHAAGAPHPLLELYLNRHLGVSLNQVHGEADRLEHALSEELEERIAEAAQGGPGCCRGLSRGRRGGAEERHRSIVA